MGRYCRKYQCYVLMGMEKKVILRINNIEKCFKNRNVLFDVEGLEGITEFSIRPSDGLKELVDGVKIRVKDVSRGRGREVEMIISADSRKYNLNFFAHVDSIY